MARHVAEAVSGREAALEVAAGTGMVTVIVAPVTRRYVATDQAGGMLAILRRRTRGLDHVEVRAADALALPFEDATFDAVVMANLVHLLPEPERALAEAHRVLRPDGLLAVPTFCHGANALAATLSRLIALTGFPIATRFRGPDLDELIRAASFQVVDARTFGGLLPVRSVIARRSGSRPGS